MKEQTWVVSHPKARAPITVKGETLEEALKLQLLDPAIWKPIEPVESPPEEPFGQNP